ncbi:MAG TPA: hypothetical protein DCL77_17435 [Prolixibacteraceae bacterium]|nr:hypothetical protein [Prolixibacteraceae bacterium]
MQIERIENQLKKSEVTEHVINILKATLSTVPFTGGLASLISDYIPTQRQIRLEEFAENIANDLLTLKDEINESYIKTDEFAFIFEKCFKGAVENYQKEKIIAFKAILINSLRDFDITQTEKEYYLNLVENLSTLHIQVLSFMAFPREFLKINGLPESCINGGFNEFFSIVIPNVSLETMKIAFKDLYDYGFLNTNNTIFSTMTASQGWSLLGDRVTKNGRKFIDFITLNY